jgi:hypothetical protein
VYGHTVPRPKRTTGEATTFTVKFSAEERDLVRRLVQARAKDLQEVTGTDVGVSIASYLRWLIERDAQTRGLVASVSRRKKS